MPIGSVLDLPWAHAYWTEGPRFLAEGYTNGQDVDRWPDELAAGGGPAPSEGWSLGLRFGIELPVVVFADDGDMIGHGTATLPSLTSAHASFNNKPALVFNGTTDLLATIDLAWPQISQTYYFVIVGRVRAVNTGVNVVQVLMSGAWTGESSNRLAERNGAWNIAGNNSVPGASGGTADTNAHLLRRRVSNFANQVHVDEVLVINDATNIGVDVNESLSVAARIDGTNPNGVQFAQLDAAFVGVAQSLSSGELADLHAYCQSHYATP